METLLSRQLQQAWLQTQMRKQQQQHMPDLSSPSPTLNASLPLQKNTSPPPASSSSSSSSTWDSAADGSWVSAASMASLPLQQQQQDFDQDSFRDPISQYINDMLMEEDMEERKCMMQECISYHATVKGFYDIIGAGEDPSRVCTNEEERSWAPVQGEDHSAQGEDHLRASAQDDHFRVFSPEEDPFRFIELEDDPARVSAHADEQALNLSGEEYQWMDDLLNNMGAISAVQEASAAMAPSLAATDFSPPLSSDSSVQEAAVAMAPWSSDSSGSVLLSPQQSSDTSSQASNNGVSQQDSFSKSDSLLSQAKPPMLYDASIFAGSSPLNFSSYGNGTQNGTKVNRKHSPILGSNGADLSQSQGSDPNKPFRRSVSETLEMPAGKTLPVANGSTDPNKPFRRPVSETVEMPASKTLPVADGSRLKRIASQVGSAVEGQQRSRSVSSPLSVEGSSKIALDSRREEVVSFVQNKDLNAERYARILNDGLALMGDEVRRFSPASIQEDFGRGAWKFATAVDPRGLLVSCAQAVVAGDIRRAHEILQDIRQDASPYGTGLQRLAHYFAEGLVARLSGTGGRLCTAFTNNAPSAAKMLKAHHLVVEVCPFVKVSHYFANKAILEAAVGASRLHIVDYGILYGLQWPCLISALAERKGGPPLLRITGIDFPQPGIKPAERVEITGQRLAEYAKTYGVPFEYHAVASKWEYVQPSSLNLRQDEVLVVNSMYRLRHLLDETVLASNPRKTVLSKIHSMNPKIFVQGIKNASHNTPFFMSRFKEALVFYSSKFDMMDVTIKSDNQERMMIEREVMGRDILNVVACEGPERVERPETYRQWQNRTHRAGFEQMPLDQKMVRQVQVIVKSTYDKNFSVDEDGHWMLLGWKSGVLYGLSLWKPMLSNGPRAK